MGNRAILAVDAGGTSIKYSLVSNDTLDQLTEEHFFNMPSSGTKEELMGTFAAVLEGAMEQSRKIDCTIASTAFSVPGPFDCKNGISLMPHKWAAVKGVCLPEEFEKMNILPPHIPTYFLHDVHAFLVGEKFFGAAANHTNTLGIIIGTGLGVGVWENNDLGLDENGNPVYSIFKRPFREGILEDYVSGRAIREAYRCVTGLSHDAKTIEIAARNGDDVAKKVYRDMGTILGENIRDIVERHRIECIVVGGRVSLAFDLYQDALCEAVGHGVTAYASKLLESAAMRGVAAWSVHCQKNK